MPLNRNFISRSAPGSSRNRSALSSIRHATPHLGATFSANVTGVGWFVSLSDMPRRALINKIFAFLEAIAICLFWTLGRLMPSPCPDSTATTMLQRVRDTKLRADGDFSGVMNDWTSRHALELKGRKRTSSHLPRSSVFAARMQPRARQPSAVAGSSSRKPGRRGQKTPICEKYR